MKEYLQTWTYPLPREYLHRLVYCRTASPTTYPEMQLCSCHANPLSLHANNLPVALWSPSICYSQLKWYIPTSFSIFGALTGNLQSKKYDLTWFSTSRSTATFEGHLIPRYSPKREILYCTADEEKTPWSIILRFCNSQLKFACRRNTELLNFSSKFYHSIDVVDVFSTTI